MKRRFIAGAVCPACGALDRIVVEACADSVTRRCVVCGDGDAMPTGQMPGSRLEAFVAREASGVIPVVLKSTPNGN